MKRIVSLILAMISVLMIAATHVGCGNPPECAEIEGRLTELIEASYDVNEVLFGKGLPTYERVYEDTSFLDSYYRDKESKKAYYYHYLEDSALGELLAYRSVAGKFGEYSYLQITSELRDGEEAVYIDQKKSQYYYKVEYTESFAEEKEYDFYYSADDPMDYDYVRMDCGYHTVDLIKAYAETVYSTGYLKSVYEMLFTGASVSDDASGTMAARYYHHTDDNGVTWLLMSNTHESLIRGKRIFDLSTAKIVRPSRKDFVNIEILTYLEGNPAETTTVRLSMIYERGNWYLDSATY